MAPGPFKAAVVGSTGAVGKALVAALLASPAWSRVVLLVRRPFRLPDALGGEAATQQAETEGRLEQHVVDFDALEGAQAHLQGVDAAFCTLGTTRSAAGSADAFRQVDLHYVDRVAALAAACGVPLFSLCSSKGANAGSWLLYFRTKGEAEEAVKAKAFERVAIFRPPMLRRGKDARFGEKVVEALTFGIGSVSVEAVAEAMRQDAEAYLAGERATGDQPAVTVVTAFA